MYSPAHDATLDPLERPEEARADHLIYKYILHYMLSTTLLAEQTAPHGANAQHIC